jgi:hypothetical protein
LLHRFHRNDGSQFTGRKEDEEELRMSATRKVDTTLGDLIAAVTDEVSPLTSTTAKTNILVSYILNDLFVTRRVRLKQKSSLKI